MINKKKKYILYLYLKNVFKFQNECLNLERTSQTPLENPKEFHWKAKFLQESPSILQILENWLFIENLLLNRPMRRRLVEQ